MRPEQRSNTHGAVSLFRKKLICRALRVSTTPKPRCVTSVFLTSRHYVARMFARFIKLPRILHSRDFRVRFAAVSRALHVGFLIPTTNLPFFRICSQSSGDALTGRIAISRIFAK